MFVTMFILLSLVNIGWSAHQHAEKDARWCNLWAVLLDEDASQPQTPRQKKIMREMDRLRTEMGCRGGSP